MLFRKKQKLRENRYEKHFAETAAASTWTVGAAAGATPSRRRQCYCLAAAAAARPTQSSTKAGPENSHWLSLKFLEKISKNLKQCRLAVSNLNRKEDIRSISFAP